MKLKLDILLFILAISALPNITFSQNKKLNIDSLFNKSDSCKYSETVCYKVIQQKLIRVNDTLIKRTYFDYAGFKKYEGLAIYKNGSIDTKYGKWTGAYSNGQWEDRTYNLNGKLDGELCVHDTNGVLISRALFKNGEVAGPMRHYYSDGKIKVSFKFKYNFNNGDEVFIMLIDTLKQYYHNGQLMSSMFSPREHATYIKNCDSTGTDCTETFYDENKKINELPRGKQRGI